MDMIKYGTRFVRRHGQRTRVQQYQCESCGRITFKPESFSITPASPEPQQAEAGYDMRSLFL